MKIDTITFTVEYRKPSIIIKDRTEDDLNSYLYAMPEGLNDYNEYDDTKKGFLGYKVSFTHRHTGIRVSITPYNYQQRIMYSLDGSSIQATEYYNPTLLSKLYENMLNIGARVTRCDIALDYINEIWTIDNFLQMEETASHKAYRNNPKVFSRHEKGVTLAETVYLGSPSSDMRLRVYDKKQEYIDKGRELHDNIYTWNRAELQLRDVKALQAFRHYMTSDSASVRGLFKAFIDIPLWDTESHTTLEPRQKDADTIRWLMETCAPSLARVAVDNNPVLVEFMSTVQAEIDAIRLIRKNSTDKNKAL